MSMKSNVMKFDEIWLCTDNIIGFMARFDNIVILTTSQPVEVSTRNNNLKKLENLFGIIGEEDLVKEEK